jgi:glucose 1-dehydrogenase
MHQPLKGQAALVNYATSKGGAKLFMQSLAQELAPHRIRVNWRQERSGRPSTAAAWETPETLVARLTLIAYGRIGTPEDIGRVVTWLASDDADYVPAQTIVVDGGMTLYAEFG